MIKVTAGWVARRSEFFSTLATFYRRFSLRVMTHDDCKNGPIRMRVAMDRKRKINKLGI